MAFLSKPTLLFLSFNALRLLSVVGLCLVFASEIVTINSDVKGMRAARADEAKEGIVAGGGETTRPATTASIKLVKRAAFPPRSPSFSHSHSSASPSISATGTGSSPTPRFVKHVHRATPVDRRRRGSFSSSASLSPRQHGAVVLHFDHGGAGLLARAGTEQHGNGLEKRDPPAAASDSSSTPRRPSSSTSTSSTPPTTTAIATTTTTTTTTTSSSRLGSTATNAPLVKKDDDETQASSSSSCAYIGETSIPKGAGGALFSTLERIFASLILLLMLFSELCPPFPPLSRPARLVDRFWSSFFPPFSDHYGVGVLGAVEVFVSCQVLSHPTKGWIQISSWYLFIIGILNMLAGLAFGARLKVIRSLGGDSTTPSALRQLRLAGGTDEKLSPHEGTAATTTTTTPRAVGFSQPTRSHLTPGASHGSNHHAADLPKEEEGTKPRFFPFSNFTASSSNKEAKKKPIQSKGASGVRTRSRNGPNGIIISAPIRPVSSGDAEQPPPIVSIPYSAPPPPPPPVYHRGE